MAKAAHPQTAGRTTHLDERVVQSLLSGMRGELIAPDSPGYEDARRVYNGMIDKRPALIARCADVADVIQAVDHARENDLLVSVRGGGHNAAGLGVYDDALVIDLSDMDGVRVDPHARSVRAEGGCTWGKLDHAAHPFGLAVPSGIISTTGVAGLTLGGGHGYLARKYGLTIDNLLAADVVLADGSFVTASEDEHADLFWAIRGGGGNFGVVTSFLFQAHPVSNVTAGPMLWDVDQAEDILRWYRDFLPNAAEDVYGFFAFLKVPPVEPFPARLHLRTMCGIVWCVLGADEVAAAALQPAREVARPAFEHVGRVPFPALQSMHDPLYPPGMEWYWKGDFVQELSDEAIRLHVEHGSRLPTMHSTMHLYPIDGAVHRVGDDETAFSYRDANWSMVIAGVDPDPAHDDAITRWAREYWEALHPYSAGGAYVNFMMEEGQDRIRATYRGNYDRLVEIKGRYDPQNLFRVNQNIQPAVPA